MFPTRGRSSIPAQLAYPVKAGVLSEALADVPQAPYLSIGFFYHNTEKSRRSDGPHPLIRAEYFCYPASQFTPHSFEENGMNSPQWQLWVEPVSRDMTQRISELLRDEGFARLRAWLVARAKLTGVAARQYIAVRYDHKADALVYEERQSRL